MDKIILVSNILNETNAYDQIGRVLGIEIDNDSDIFREIEEFIVEKFEEMGEREWNVEAIVEITDEDGEVIDNETVQANIFAKNEDEAMDKAEDNIREENPEWEDCSIDVVSATEA